MERWALCYRAIPEKNGNDMFIYALIDDVAEFNRIRDRDGRDLAV